MEGRGETLHTKDKINGKVARESERGRERQSERGSQSSGRMCDPG